MLINNTSISFRLSAWFSTILFLGWILFGVMMRYDLEHTLTAGRYQTLSRRADRLKDLLERIEDQTPEARNQEFQKFTAATGDGLIQIYRRDGSLAFPAPSADAALFPWPGTSDREAFIRVKFRGQRYRILARPMAIGTERYFACLGAPLAGNMAILDHFSFGLLLAMPVLLIASAAGGYFVCRRALSPVDKMTSLARNISVWNLSDRLPVPETRDELQRLAQTCNQMLGRLDTAVAQIRDFTANASHELRSPLSSTRTMAEVALLNPQVDQESARTFQEIVQECTKATAVLEDMLTLARADSDRGHTKFEPIDLAEVAEEVCDSVRGAAESRGHRVRLRGVHSETTWIRGDADILRRLVFILLDNAQKYTGSPGFIEVELESRPEEIVLRVQDNGVGIAESDLPHVFERFYRAERSRDLAEGSGLGLAIAKWIAEVHRAELKITSKVNAGTKVEVVFPAFASAEIPSKMSL